MDPLTHTLFGIAIGEAFFARRYGPRAVIVSAWAANLPDIDGLVMLTGDPGAVLLRRSFGHSLFLLPVWIAILAWIFKKRYDDLSYLDLLLIVTLNAAGHLFFDLINSFGVQLFWPLSLVRPELAIIFIIDVALIGFLAAPQLLRLREEWRPHLPEASQTALVAVAFYLSLAFSARQIATGVLARETGGGGFEYVFAEPLGAHRWRGVVKDPGGWRIYLLDSARGTATRMPGVTDAEQSPQALAARNTPLGIRLGAFFKAPVWTVEPGEKGGWVAKVHDLRFTSLVLPRPPSFEFAFDVDEKPSGGAKPRGVKIW